MYILCIQKATNFLYVYDRKMKLIRVWYKNKILCERNYEKR